MSTVVRIVDAWKVLGIWFAADVAMAAWGHNLPDWLRWNTHDSFAGDYFIAALLIWLQFAYGKKIKI